MKKLLFVLSFVAILFTGCNKDDDPTEDPISDKLNGDITSDVTLDATVAYTITGTLSIKDGATLTIPAGTTIKAEKGFENCLIVEQGGRIMAQGTASKPITFTSAESSPAAGDWGGIILCGYAPISAETAGGTGQVETDTDIEYGGTVSNDNSGTLEYVIIEYTGANLNDEVEHNGLTLYGVGSGTTISNIYVAYGADDGVEFFGGTVDVSNILVVNPDDDMFDCTQGWSGTLSNAYGIWEPGYNSTEDDPRGVEADGNLDGNYPDYTIQSNFTITDLTIKNASGYKMTDGIKIRRGATATITNALIIGGIASDIIDLHDGKGDATTGSEISLTVDRTGYSSNEINATDGVTYANVVVEAGNTGASSSDFAWTGYNFDEEYTESISGDLTEDMTLNALYDYTLDGTLSVKDGATLTIPAGTTIKAEKGFENCLIVEQGGKIMAQGTAGNPITFTSAETSPDAGDWGGVILCGYAPISAETAGGTGQVETDTDIEYGGTDSDDDSGILEYVIIEYTGANLNDEVEHNGLTLYGVGSGTTISDIYVAYGADDGVEFFGGTVDVSNILVVNPDDDMFDCTQGWSGTLSNAYGIWEAGYSSTEDDPRGVEADGNLDGNYPDYALQSNFTITNLTIKNLSTYEMTDGIKIRRGATATITNALIIGGTASDIIDLHDGKGDATTSTSISLTIDGTVASSHEINIADGVTYPNVAVVAGNAGASADSFTWTGYNF